MTSKLIMDYHNYNIDKDNSKTWKSFNKLTIYTIAFIKIILIIFFTYFNYPTISSSVKKNNISFFAFSSESDP